MEKVIVTLVGGLTNADPVAVIAIVCVVALLVVRECVRQFCKALTNKGKD